MSRNNDQEKLHILSESNQEHPELLAYVFNNVKMQKGSQAKRIKEQNFNNVDQRISKAFSVKDNRETVDLNLIPIPEGMTPSEVWELIKVDPKYSEDGELAWELTGAEHEVALNADARLSQVKDKKFWVVATRSSADFEGRRDVPGLECWGAAGVCWA